MALNLGDYRSKRARGMDPKGTEQQNPEGAINWPSYESALGPEPVSTAPVVNDTQRPNVTAKIGFTDQSMWPKSTPSKSGLAQRG